jgi:hypothetical protein
MIKELGLGQRAEIGLGRKSEFHLGIDHSKLHVSSKIKNMCGRRSPGRVEKVQEI